jgi:hypothetical protein
MSSQSYPFGTASQLFEQGYQLEELVFGPPIIKGPLTLPQTATSTLYTVTGGAIIVTGFLGLVTTAIGGNTNLSIGITPSGGSNAPAGIASATALTNALTAGSVIAMPATPGGANATIATPVSGNPVSGTPYTNNYQGTVQVVVSTGTGITSVVIGGNTVQSGAGSGTFQVPQHESITINWTTTQPTFAWTASTALQSGTPGTVVNLAKEHVVPAGVITWTTSASVTGAIKWYLTFMPLDGASAGFPNGAYAS